MSLYDGGYSGGYDEQVAGTVFESPDFTESVDLGPANPLSGGPISGFRPAHGVLVIFLFAIVGLMILSRVFRSHNLG